MSFLLMFDVVKLNFRRLGETSLAFPEFEKEESILLVGLVSKFPPGRILPYVFYA